MLRLALKVPGTTLAVLELPDNRNIQAWVLGCRNYPGDRDVGIGTKLWKTGMDRVYLPFYRSFMIKDQGETTQYNNSARYRLQVHDDSQQHAVASEHHFSAL
jgi:hypothetical protein